MTANNEELESQAGMYEAEQRWRAVNGGEPPKDIKDSYGKSYAGNAGIAQRREEISRKNDPYTKGPNASKEALADEDEVRSKKEKAAEHEVANAKQELEIAQQHAREAQAETIAAAERLQAVVEAQQRLEEERAQQEAALARARQREQEEEDRLLREQEDVRKKKLIQEATNTAAESFLNSQEQVRLARERIKNDVLTALNDPVKYTALVELPTREGSRQRYGTAEDEATWSWGRLNPQTLHEVLRDAMEGPPGVRKPQTPPYNTAKFQERFASLAAGAAGEIFSGMLELDECHTAHISDGVDIRKLVKIDPIFTVGGPLKEDIRTMNMARVNREREKLEQIGEADPKYTQRKAALELAFNKLTEDKPNVMPDGFLVSKSDRDPRLHNIVGVVEDKLYTPIEVDAWVSKMEQEFAQTGKLARDFRAAITPQDLAIARERLIAQYPSREEEFNNIKLATTEMKKFGVDLGAEINFLDMMRLAREMPEIGKDGVIALRFAEDVPQDILKRLGTLCDGMGYKVIIQQLPFTREEVTDLGILKAAEALEASIVNHTTTKYTTNEIRDVRALAAQVRGKSTIAQ